MCSNRRPARKACPRCAFSLRCDEPSDGSGYRRTAELRLEITWKERGNDWTTLVAESRS